MVLNFNYELLTLKFQDFIPIEEFLKMACKIKN